MTDVRARLGIGTTALALIGALGACSSSEGSAGSRASTSSTAPAEPLRILVTNDDGYSAEGIDTVVEALRRLPGVKVTVVAPADQRSGTGSRETPGELTATEQRTASGYPATAVDGYPVDTVTYAMSKVFTAAPPDLVVSGINEGQNLGPVVNASGTVGAAKAAVGRGLPALAASAGETEPVGQAATIPPDYDTAATLVVQWVTAHRNALLAGPPSPATVVNLNTPTCTTGRMRGLKQVPAATDGAGALDPANCESTATEVPDDITAFLAGFAAVTELDAAGQTVTTSTTWPKPR
jgi:5'-nucleotidase